MDSRSRRPGRCARDDRQASRDLRRGRSRRGLEARDRRRRAAGRRVHAHTSVVDYDARKDGGAQPRAGRTIRAWSFEAHSTDYQTPAALAQLVQDHFAILKVGPAVTFAVREALWALDTIEMEWIDAGRWSRLREIAIERMKADPRHWSKYYTSSGAELAYDLQYSLSDRIRYYWGQSEIVAAQKKLFDNLTQASAAPGADQPVPAGRIRRQPAPSRASLAPKALVIEHVRRVLEGYSSACTPAGGADDMSALGMEDANLQARGALWTAREIAQQPAMLLKTQELLVARQRELEAFLRPLIARPELRVILDRRRQLVVHRRVPGAVSGESPEMRRRGDRDDRHRLRAAHLPATAQADPAGLLRAFRQQPGERRRGRAGGPFRGRGAPPDHQLQCGRRAREIRGLGAAIVSRSCCPRRRTTRVLR